MAMWWTVSEQRSVQPDAAGGTSHGPQTTAHSSTVRSGPSSAIPRGRPRHPRVAAAIPSTITADPPSLTARAQATA